jgi:hypothetical protein
VVLQQVVKLLQVTEAKGATQAEAAAAAAKAQALMFTYNLTQADVSKGARGKVTVEQGSFGMQSDTWRGHHYWQEELLAGICRFNFCMVLEYEYAYNPKVGRYVISTVQVVGTPANIRATEYLYAYLYRQIHQLAVKTRRDTWKAARARLTERHGEAAAATYTWGELGVPSTVVWERSFGDGATAEVVDRLRIQRMASEQEVGPEAGAMVLTLDREVEEAWYLRKFGMTKAAHEAKQKADEAHWAKAAKMRAAHQADLEAQYEAGTLPRPKARKPRKERYRSPRTEAYHYAAEELGHEHGRQIAIRPGMDGDSGPAGPAPQLGGK